MTRHRTALASMTGFARIDGTSGDSRWTWEIRSVNGKGLEPRFRLAQGREHLEQAARKILGKHLTRGNVNAVLSLHLDRAQGVPQVNEAALATMLDVAARFQGDDRVDPPRLDGLLALRGVVELTDATMSEEDARALDADLLAGLEKAAEALHTARCAEGESLKTVLTGLVDGIDDLVDRIEACPATGIEAIRARLDKQVESLLGDAGELDSQRLHQEVVLLATKADIREEIDRLRAHVEAARALLAEGHAIGRRFDFLAQEFNREANTVCSKSNDKDLTALGLQLKTLIDRLREQIQNVE